MLDEAFADVYTKFKLHFYKQVFGRFAQREATLTTVESFCMEVILAMGTPTVAEFSNMMQISTPNAAYKISSLVQKGYIEKVRSETDRREYHLVVTQKYRDYYNISYQYLKTVIDRAKERFEPEPAKVGGDAHRGQQRADAGNSAAGPGPQRPRCAAPVCVIETKIRPGAAARKSTESVPSPPGSSARPLFVSCYFTAYRSQTAPFS